MEIDKLFNCIKNNFFAAVLTLVWLFSYPLLGQNKFVSNLDEELTLKTICTLPTRDNLSGIYSKKVDEKINLYLKDNFFWEVRTCILQKNLNKEIVFSIEQIKEIAKLNQVDGVFYADLLNGAKGLQIRLDLYSAISGNLVFRTLKTDIPLPSFKDFEFQLLEEVNHLKSKIPYLGIVLSRKAETVTINIGGHHKVNNDDEFTVYQIISAQRHPTQKFITQTDKEILGRLKILKIEDNLSFAQVILEREPGVVRPHLKIMKIDKDIIQGPPPKAIDDDHKFAFGNQPVEWQTMPKPTFGKVGLQLGLSTYSLNNNLRTSGGVQGQSSLATSLRLNSEFWFTQNWIAQVSFDQYIFNISNSLANSTPSSLNVNATEMALLGGYNFLLEPSFWGPKLQVLFGYFRYASTVDDSTPSAHSSPGFSGIMLGAGGSMPIDQKGLYEVGATYYNILFPIVSESGKTSGDPTGSNVNHFNIFGTYQWNQNFLLKAEFKLKSYTTKFNGTGSRSESASSLSHQMTTTGFGFEYLF